MSSDLRVEIDGRRPLVEQLAFPALVNYGHFTAMQVRGGRVRGLSLHLARLEAATQELFGSALDSIRVRAYVRHAVGPAGDVSVRVGTRYDTGGTGGDGICKSKRKRPRIWRMAGRGVDCPT